MNEVFLRGVTAEELTNEIAEAVLHRIADKLSSSTERRLLGREETAERLGISVPKLDAMVQANEIPSKLLGKRRLFDIDAVIESIPNSN
jgi:excisionase family DNA binding protein